MKVLVFNILAFLFLISALVFFWARFTDGAIDVTINDSTETVYFKPAHSLEFALFSGFLSIAFFGLTRLFWPKIEEETIEDVLDKNLSPDEAWSKYLESSLKYVGTYDKIKIKEYFDELGKFFQTYKIHNFEEVSESSIKIELRGLFKDFPVKINFSYFNNDLLLSIKADVFPAYLEIYKKSGLFSAEKAKSCPPDYLETYIRDYAKAYSCILNIEYDPGKIPVHKDISDPWNKDEVLRIFVAKGIFIEGYEEISNLYLAVFQSFSEEFRNILTGFMINNQIRHIVLYHEEVQIAYRSVQLLKKPISAVDESLKMLLAIAAEFETVSYSGIMNFDYGNDEKSVKVRLATCSYCSSKYPLVNECKCPNCGASYS